MANNNKSEQIVITFQPGTDNVQWKGPATLGAVAALRITEAMLLKTLIETGTQPKSGIVLPDSRFRGSKP
jgi:hypothetical protein